MKLVNLQHVVNDEMIFFLYISSRVVVNTIIKYFISGSCSVVLVVVVGGGVWLNVVYLLLK